MKVVFLDIDGVLNSNQWYERRVKKYSNIEIAKEYPILEFDPLAIDCLNMITNVTEAVIIITSSWRFDKNIYELLKSVGITGFIGEKTNDFGYIKVLNDIQEIDNYRIPRGCEINYWLNNHQITNYVILDDDIDMLYCQKDNFIPIDAKHGLTIHDANKAIKILNNNNYGNICR